MSISYPELLSVFLIGRDTQLLVEKLNQTSKDIQLSFSRVLQHFQILHYIERVPLHLLAVNQLSHLTQSEMDRKDIL